MAGQACFGHRLLNTVNTLLFATIGVLPCVQHQCIYGETDPRLSGGVPASSHRTQAPCPLSMTLSRPVVSVAK